jgi:hypothetical protein
VGKQAKYGDDFGAFRIPCALTSVKLVVIASAGSVDGHGLGIEYAWDHVSVSLQGRCPNWYEMEFIRKLFFLPEETCMQLHVPRSEHRNIHPNCLHIWRPLLVDIPRPPNGLV